jgi:hypothetical protein
MKDIELKAIFPKGIGVHITVSFYLNIWCQFDVLLSLFCSRACDRHHRGILGDSGQGHCEKMNGA